jgi:diguanylate cyclase (GGDEF)-like protein
VRRRAVEENKSKAARILIVDDAVANIEVLDDFLSRQYEVAFATRVAEAEALLAQDSFDLVLLDVQLPDGDGFSLCRRMKANENCKDVPVIFISGNSADRDLAEGLRAGGADYLPKPFHPGELLSRIELHLTMRRQKQELDAARRLQQEQDTRAAWIFQSVSEFELDRGERKPTVLVVDDNAGNIEALAAALADLAEVKFALSGEQALKLCAEEAPDLVLLDVIMPGLSGHEVCRRLKEQPETSSIPVIFLTALDACEDEQQGLDIGAIDYITKPFRTGIVRARVRNQLVLALHRRALHELSLTDGLTGLPNRRHFDLILQREWLRGARNGEPLSLLLLDIDHFKRYNDFYGHLSGDDCLRRVGAALKDMPRRATDMVARYGGEEFVVLLPNTDARGAEAFAKLIVSGIAGLDIPHKFNDAGGVVTVSVGGVAVSATGKGGDAGAALAALQCADARLYQAKEQGRNRAVVAAAALA